MLQEALPLAWEEALRFAQEKGFATKKEIKKRIDLAEKYNLEVEHFFYDPEKLEKEIPSQEQIKSTAQTLTYTNEFAKEFSQQFKTPVLCIFNARCGTIYSYGMDTRNNQLNYQFKELFKKENKMVRELRNEFSRDLKSNQCWRTNKRLALIKTANKWMENGRLSYHLEYDLNTKFPSAGSSDYIDNKTGDIINKNERDGLHMKKSDVNFFFVDSSSFRHGPASFSRIIHRMQVGNFKYLRRKHIDDYGQDKLSPDRAVLNILSQTNESSPVSTKILFDPSTNNDLKKVSYVEAGVSKKGYGDVWWDNFPQVLGKIGKKFVHKLERLFPTEKFAKSAQCVEYLSRKVKVALRYYQKDEEGRNWYERNFEGIMLGKKNVPEKGSKEYLEMFRKWVPYETDEKGEGKLDDKGYPIPRKEAPMTMAAEDELARVEAAMGEIEK